MTVSELICTLAPPTEVRITDNRHKTVIAGRVGAKTSAGLRAQLERDKLWNAHVLVVHPLFHAHELYIECVRC